MARRKTAAVAVNGRGTGATRGKLASAAAKAGRPASQSHAGDDDVEGWESETDELALDADIDGMLLARAQATLSTDPMARRRIEMLREERLLQQSLSDGFDL